MFVIKIIGRFGVFPFSIRKTYARALHAIQHSIYDMYERCTFEHHTLFLDDGQSDLNWYLCTAISWCLNGTFHSPKVVLAINS